MKRQMTKSMMAGSLIVTLAGCGGQYDDRPFVMSCTGETVAGEPRGTAIAHYTENFPYNAGGIPLPTPNEMASRVGPRRLELDGYFGLRFLTPDEGRLPKENTTTINITDHTQYVAGWEGGNEVYYLERGTHDIWRQFEGLKSPSGSVEVEHYYMDENGELHPVNFQLTGLYQSRTGGREMNRNTRGAQLGAFIPADAKYVVYKKTWDFTDTEGYEDTELLESWWATPLVERYRFRPNDYQKAKNNPLALSQYTFWLNNEANTSLRQAQFPSHSMPPEGKKGYHSVDCYAKAGEPFRYSRFLRLETSRRAEEKGVWVKMPAKMDTPIMMFVGQVASDLEKLPSNPNDWHGKNHFIWENADPRMADIFFPL